MRGPLVLLALLTVGCLASPPLPPPAGSDTGWTLDCSLGEYEMALDASWPHACATRASHTPGSKTELWLGVNPNNPDNVVIGAKEVGTPASADCVWNAVSVTTDGGRTWSDLNIGGPRYADRKPGEPWFGYACNTDPILAFSANGDVHYGVEVYNFGFQTYHTPPRQALGSSGLLGWKILLATSHDGGLTWPDVITYQQDLVTVTDYSRMTISPTTGSILEAINHLGAGDCHVLASRDGGRTADPHAVAQPVGPETRSGCQVIAAAPDGTIVLGVGGAPTYWMRSTDDGRTFLEGNTGFSIDSVGTFQENTFRTGTNFEVAYDLTDGPARGTLYVIYGDDASGNADLFVRKSKDHGRTWSDAVRVDDDAGQNDQFLPNIAVASDGSLHAFFLDKRWDAQNKLLDATWAMSVDGGVTWKNQRVTNMSFDGDLGRHQNDGPFIGDYIGIGSVGDDVWATFPDTTNGETAVVAAARVHKAS